jgi:hypothetical protein
MDVLTVVEKGVITSISRSACETIVVVSVAVLLLFNGSIGEVMFTELLRIPVASFSTVLEALNVAVPPG